MTRGCSLNERLSGMSQYLSFLDQKFNHLGGIKANGTVKAGHFGGSFVVDICTSIQEELGHFKMSKTASCGQWRFDTKVL
eukprot:TCALIF_07338-PB protein Name:"Protein of unknown function" AED:0.98 eAED:1.00 QI:0/0/0/0.5/0/0.5/2/0/79